MTHQTQTQVRSSSDPFNVLLEQEHSLLKLECFINAAKMSVGCSSQTAQLVILLEACQELARDLKRHNVSLFAARSSQRVAVSTHAECAFSPEN